MTVTRTNKKFYTSFENGLNQLSRIDLPKFKDEVEILLAYNGTTFNAKAKGARPLTPSDMKTIERVFKKYGVTQNIWSDPKLKN